MLSEKKILNETINHTPPCKLNGRSLKMFRWKLFHFIIPNKVLLSKWKIVGNSLCNFCKLDEDYSHYFITCTFLKEFWTKFQNLIEGFGYRKQNYFEAYSTWIQDR